MPKIKHQNWVVCDPDYFQNIRRATEYPADCQPVFEVMEIATVGDRDDSCIGCKALVFINDFLEDDDDVDELTAILKGFGYKDALDVRKQYGSNANQIIAECIFEVMPLQDKTIVCGGTFDECSAFLKNNYIDGYAA